MSVPRIALIGHGAMAKALIQCLKRQSRLTIGAALVRSVPVTRSNDDPLFLSSIQDLLAWRPDLVVECAGHAAVRDSAPRVLEHGIDMIIASVGALGDTSLTADIARAAERGDSRLVVPAGAVGGIDALRAARLGGLEEVRYVGRKPPHAWLGTPAEKEVTLLPQEGERIVFEGNAGDAIRLFPKNANVTAAIAIAGTGFAETRVRLISDPAITRNQHEIEAEGSFGRFRIVLENQALASNPKTSELAVLSVAQAVIGHFKSVEIL